MGLYLYRFGNDPQSLETMDRMARMAADAGVKWSREEFNWARIETRKGQYDWSFYDNLVKTANRHGISVYGLLAYWSRWTEPYTPQGIDDYCRFAAAAAERYRGVIRHWEVYNEPNIFFWQGPRDMYAELLKKAYTAIKKANPEAEVLGCSTAGIDTKFIKRTIELGAPFDSLTIHPYRRSLHDRAFVQELRKAAEIAKNADGTVRPVWITEMGWGTHTHHNGAPAGFAVTTQREQACLIARTYVDAIASGVVANTCWYDFRNDGYDPFNFEHNMGIVRRDFRPKPAYRAYATVARLLQGKSIDRELNLGDDVIAYRFASDDGTESAVAVWTLLDSQTVQLPIAEPASVINLMGESQTVKPARGKIILALERETPVFVSRERR
jgi:GH35 family endo-1,4-beta-xylanase